MDCLTCGTKMKCVNDVNEESARIDFVECPKCGSKADIIYHSRKGWIEKVNWKR